MKQNKMVKKLLAFSMAVIMACSVGVPSQAAKKSLSVSVKKISLQEGETKIVTVNKKVTWISTNKKVAKVKKISAQKAKITAVKKGSCKIIAKYGKKKVTIKVNVSKEKETITPTITPNVTVTPTAVTVPTVEPTATSTAVTVPTSVPAEIPTVTQGSIGAYVSDVKATSNFMSVTVHMYNQSKDSEEELMYGLNFSIEKLENGKWKTVEPKEKMVFPMVLTGVPVNHEKDESYTIKETKDSVTPGHYRINLSMHTKKKSKLSNKLEFDISSQMLTPSITPNVTVTPTAVTIPTVKPIVTPTVTTVPTVEPIVTPTVTTVPTVEPTVTPNPPVTPGSIGAYVSDVKATSNSISVTVNMYNQSNNSEEELIYGMVFSIEKLEDGKWKRVQPKEEMAFIALAGLIDVNQERDERYTIKETKDSVTSGHYRINLWMQATKGSELNTNLEFDITI